MKILILGAGQVGSTAAYSLAREEANEVTIVDRNPDVLRELQDRLDIRTVVGHASHPDVLERAGGKRRRHDHRADEQRRDQHGRVPGRVHAVPHADADRPHSRGEYTSREQLFGPGRIPVDVAISPARSSPPHRAADRVSRARCRCSTSPTAARSSSRCARCAAARWSASRSASCAKHLPNVGRARRRDLPPRPADHARGQHRHRGRRRGVLPRRRAGHPDGHERAAQLDEPDAPRLDRRRRQHRPQPREEPRVATTGEGARALARARAQLAEELPNSIVLVGDCADEDLLREENIDQTDVYCAMTNDDEANILSAMLAKRLGCPQVMALINRRPTPSSSRAARSTSRVARSRSRFGRCSRTSARATSVRVHSLRRGAAEAIEAVALGDRAHRAWSAARSRSSSCRAARRSAASCAATSC